MFFFVFSKSILLSYYKRNLEKLIKKKPKVVDSQQLNTTSNNVNLQVATTNSSTEKNKLIQTPKQEAKVIFTHPSHSMMSLSAKSSAQSKKNFKKVKRASNSIPQVLTENIDIILKPPSHVDLKGADNDNILDDLIEAPTKVKIPNHPKNTNGKKV